MEVPDALSRQLLGSKRVFPWNGKAVGEVTGGGERRDEDESEGGEHYYQHVGGQNAPCAAFEIAAQGRTLLE